MAQVMIQSWYYLIGFLMVDFSLYAVDAVVRFIQDSLKP